MFSNLKSLAGTIFLNDDVTRASGSIYGRVNDSLELAFRAGINLENSMPSAEAGFKYAIEKDFSVSSKITHDLKVRFISISKIKDDLKVRFLSISKIKDDLKVRFLLILSIVSCFKCS